MLVKSDSILANEEVAYKTIGMIEGYPGMYFLVPSISEAKQNFPSANIFEASQDEILAARSKSEAAKQIDGATATKIRSKYSLAKELQALRTNDPEYRAFVDQVVAEHNAAKDALLEA